MRRWQQALGVYVLLLVFSVILARFQVITPQAVSSVTAPLASVALVAADNIRKAVTGLTAQRKTEQDFTKLQQQNDQLRQQNEYLTIELRRLRQITEITDTQAPNAVGVAQVIGADPSPILARLTLNKGSLDGVRVHMPVTTSGGLVGQVVEVGPRTSAVMALVDPVSQVGVTLSGGRGGRGLGTGSPPNRVRVQFSLGFPVKVGDTVVSSSLGGVYPVGIRVGTVEKLLPVGPNDVTQGVIVKPAVDVDTVEDVTILGAL